MKYYYDDQLMRHMIQFMAIFTNMTVVTGKRGEDCEAASITVPVQYGSKDRVTAAILNQNTQNKPLRLPVMSAYMRSIRPFGERRKGVSIERKLPYVPLGGLLPDDVKVAHILMGIPYEAQVDLTVYTSNLNTHWQILEQIFILFDPLIQIQTSDGAFDPTKITTVELVGVNYEENFPAGTSRRMLQTTLNFKMPIYMSAPAIVRQNAIKDIYMRIGTVNGDLTSQNIIQEFMDQGLEYDLLISAGEELDNDDVE